MTFNNIFSLAVIQKATKLMACEKLFTNKNWITHPASCSGYKTSDEMTRRGGFQIISQKIDYY